MISASKPTYNLKILRPKVTKNIKNLRKKFCEFPPRTLTILFLFRDIDIRKVAFLTKHFH